MFIALKALIDQERFLTLFTLTMIADLVQKKRNETYFGHSQSPFFISMSSRPTRFFGGGGGCFTFGGDFLKIGGGRFGSIGTALNLTTS